MEKSICFVVTQGELGGAQRYVFDLAASLAGSYRVLVVVGAEKSELQQKLQEANVEVKMANNLVRKIHPIKDLRAIFELRKVFREIKPDIVHLNSSKAGVMGSISARLAGIKNVIFTAHGFAFLEPHSWIIRQIYFWAEKIASLFRRKIICVSEFDRQEAIKWGLCQPEKLVTIHNGIEPFNVIATPSLARGKQSHEIATGLRPRDDRNTVIGTIANLYKTKGLEYLIEAAHILNTKYQILNTKFLVIGEGQERGNLESQIRNNGLQDKFILLGAKPDAAQYLPQFDIFVLPSIKEGFPYTILEAMSAGLPIVATAVGGIPEMLTPSLSPPISQSETGGDEVGVLVPPKDPQAQAEAIRFLVNNPGIAKKLGQNAQAKVKEFTAEKMINKTIGIYESLRGV